MSHHSLPSRELCKMFDIPPPPPLPPPLVFSDQQQMITNTFVAPPMPLVHNMSQPTYSNSGIQQPRMSQPAHCNSGIQQPHFAPVMPRMPIRAQINTYINSSTTQHREPLLTEDEKWLSNWLSRVRGPNSSCESKSKSKTTVKIFEASEHYKRSVTILKELEALHSSLSSDCESLSEVEWQTKWREVENKKVALSQCLSVFSNPEVKNNLKLALKKRAKKRAWQKRRRERQRAEKEEDKARLRQLHSDIDKWLEDMQDAVEKAKRDESLKAEADRVLSDVTQKKAEAKRQVALLTSLQKLRQIREKKRISQGSVFSLDTKVHFAKVIDRLKVMWDQQLRDYQLEEQGLRVMLEEEEQSQRHKSKAKICLTQWEHLLFGRKKSSIEMNNTFQFLTAADRNTEAFISVRQQWDKFLSYDRNDALSTPIPVGWVLPAAPSSEKWAKLLASNP